MIFYYVILLFLCWPQTRCAEYDDSNVEEMFDQIATASENVARATMHPNASSQSAHQEQLSSVPTSTGVATHYENSNGFVPMVPPSAATPSYDDADSSSSQTDDLEQRDDRPEESNATNAEGASEFELLKVNNDTPAVANYQDFYENVRSTVSTEVVDNRPDASSSTSSSSSSGRISNGERGKRIEHHVRNYGRQSHRTGGENTYAQYYSYGGAQDAKIAHEREKVAGNYRQQDTANYDGHGQSGAAAAAAAAGQSTVPSSTRTNYEANELTHGGTHGVAYDSVADSSISTDRGFSKPVVVAETNDYKVDAIFGSQLRDDPSEDKISRNLESTGSSEISSSRYEVHNDSGRQRSYHRGEDSRNFSDESTDYTEYAERARRPVQKSRRRPAYTGDSARKLPKEHRGTASPDDNAEQQDKHRYVASKLKSQRYRTKANPWTNDAAANHHDESAEDARHDHRGGDAPPPPPPPPPPQTSKSAGGRVMQPGFGRPRNGNAAWSHAPPAPSLEISHVSGIELDHVERPKYVPVPINVNFVPLANFDHATALGSSQGFDVSNAVLHNLVTAAPIGAFTTSAPLLSAPQVPVQLAQNLALSKNLANLRSLGLSTSVPDIVVGQNTFHNPMHAVLLPQPGGQNKVGEPPRGVYLPSTMTPVFALTSSLAPTLQSVRLQNVPGNVTPRTAAFAVTPTPVVQHIPVNQAHPGVQQLIVPQPTIQTLSGFLQTPLHANSGYHQIQVNPRGLQGQNPMDNHHGNLQAQSLSTAPAMPEGRANADSQDKKSVNLLATASLAVGQNEQRQAASGINSYYLQNHNPQPVIKPKTYVQATQLVPTVLQSGPTLSAMALSAQQLIPTQQTQQYLKLQSADDATKGARLPTVVLQTTDNAASHSNNVNSALATSPGSAHLPNVGTKNVEILNPNIKPSPVDATVNAFGTTMHYPATVLTTPIPIFSTIASVTPHAISLQNYVDSLTETGAKAKQLGTSDLRTSQNQERPVFNPINFVPNVDIIKNQNALNNKLPSNEPLQPGLNLVPVVPGGNFFKPSFTAQNELIMKPKLASDLQKYAEEMFKESLKTMYNSQKWNNDRRPFRNLTEASDLAKLRLELQKLAASLTESKYRDMLEAHQSENKVHTTDAPKSDSEKKKHDPLLATLEQLLKNRPPGPIHIYHGSSRPGRKPKPTDDSNFGPSFHEDSRLTEFLTPPRPHSFHTKDPFHDKPVKKRPGTSRYKNGLRKRPGNSRPGGPEASASSINVHLDGTRYRAPTFDRDNVDFDARYQPSFEVYPTFTTSTPDVFGNILRELKAKNKDYDINHPRVHNFLGLLMKNKQLPVRSTHGNYFRDGDQMRQFFDSERRRLQQKFYDDALKDYLLEKFEGASRSGTVAGRKVIHSRNGTA